MVINELLEVLFFRNLKDLTEKVKYLDRLYYPDYPEKCTEGLNQFVLDTIKDKKSLFEIVGDYHRNGYPAWQRDIRNDDVIDMKKMTSMLKHGTAGHGGEIFDIYLKMRDKWACHLDDYANLVNCGDELRILELATGAGLGTCAVIKDLKQNSSLISVDIDLGAAKNADGLAGYFHVRNRVCGLNANFWKLPFERDLFDVVCTHYGLDESGELPITLSQIAKVLKPNGKFIGVCRNHPFDRHKRYLEMFGVNESECNVLLEKARLFSGFENLIETAGHYGLQLKQYKEYAPLASHSRIAFLFIKDK